MKTHKSNKQRREEIMAALRRLPGKGTGTQTSRRVASLSARCFTIVKS